MRATSTALGSLLYLTTCIYSYEITSRKDVQEYLEKYGYFEKMKNKNLTEGISMFQQFSGVQVTGKVDNATVDLMNKPRCGMPERTDMMENKWMTRQTVTHQIAPNRNRKRRFKSSRVFYRIGTFPEHFHKIGLDNGTAKKEIRKAFDLWENAANLRCVEVIDDAIHIHGSKRHWRRKADIDINFVVGEHGDGSAFGMMAVGNVAAHAFFPDHKRFRGNIHFDNEREWSALVPTGVNLYQVAAHEIGHALGLEHSRFEDSVMHMLLKPTLEMNFKLHQDDIMGIRKLYGTRKDNMNRSNFDRGRHQSMMSQRYRAQPTITASNRVTTPELGQKMLGRTPVVPRTRVPLRNSNNFWHCFSYLPYQRNNRDRNCYTQIVSRVLGSLF